MLKFTLIPMALCLAAVGFGQKNTVHHAAMHAEHWTSSHVNAPHKRFRHKYHFKKHHDRSTHHAAVHAEHWLSSHVNAPHKKP